MGCQVPSPQAIRIGDSGVPPLPYNESRFVADEAPGTLDEVRTLTAAIDAFLAR